MDNKIELELIRNLASKIEKLSGGMTTYIIENYSKLNQPILIAFSDGAANKIFIYNTQNGSDAIGRIRYTNRTDKVYISSFEVERKYQQRGLGKLLFNLALAHADYIGVTKAYGHATPINEVLGINSANEDSFEQILQVLFVVYEKLGCKFDFHGENNTFTQLWKSGERFNKLPQDIQNTIKIFEERKNSHSIL